MNQLSVAVVVEPLWHPVPGGTGRATRELIKGLAARPDILLTTMSARHRHDDNRLANGDVDRRWRMPRVVLYESWARFQGWPGTSNLARDVDLVHSPMLPTPRRGNRPLVVTLHDLAFVQQPEASPPRARRLYERMWARVRDEADLVLCSSEATRTAAVEAGLAAGRARVVPLGVSIPDAETIDGERVRHHHGLDCPYVLFVGTAEPRKNLTTLLAAYTHSGLADIGMELVMVGPSGWREQLGQRVAELPEEISRHVRVLGEVDDTELHALYSEADIFCYPSTLEGFGLPVLEAMAHGTPVITSRGTATAEVAAEAAILIDALNVEELARALRELAGDSDRATELGRLGSERARQFSWSRHIDLTLEAYRELVR